MIEHCSMNSIPMNSIPMMIEIFCELGVFIVYDLSENFLVGAFSMRKIHGHIRLVLS